MATITPATLPAYALAGLLFYGSFSRFTHGQHTPAFYAYQTARSPDDGSTAATMLPIIDAVLATFLAFKGRSWRRGAAIFAAVAQGAAAAALWYQGRSDLDLRQDLGICALAVIAAVGASLEGEAELPRAKTKTK